MKIWNRKILLILAVALAAPLASIHLRGEDRSPDNTGEPIQALLITSGCCHNYEFQSSVIMEAVEGIAEIEWTVINDGGTGTSAEIPLYENPHWAQPFDVVIHNECFANTDSPEYIRKIVNGHRSGTPAVVIHCAMHTYRETVIDDWRQFLGVTSRKHEHKSHYPVTVEDTEHPVMKAFPRDWVTPLDELYVIDKLWPNTKSLASSSSESTGKRYTVIWTNDFGGTRVFGTTFGHSDETFRDPVFQDLLAKGILWAAGKLD